MKYLKKFNELKSQTYTKAAKALQSLGHTRRAAAMTDYVATVEEKERLQRIKDTLSSARSSSKVRVTRGGGRGCV